MFKKSYIYIIKIFTKNLYIDWFFLNEYFRIFLRFFQKTNHYFHLVIIYLFEILKKKKTKLFIKTIFLLLYTYELLLLKVDERRRC
jgi:hypothetical protein